MRLARGVCTICTARRLRPGHEFGDFIDRHALTAGRYLELLQDTVAEEEQVQLLGDQFGTVARLGVATAGKDDDEAAAAANHDIVGRQAFLDEMGRRGIDLVLEQLPFLAGLGADHVQIDPLEMPDIDRIAAGEGGLQSFEGFRGHHNHSR